VLSKAKMSSRLVAGIAGSNLAEGMEVLFLCLLRCVCSGLCDELIIRSEESYRVYMSNWV
jgi:hypothetical protein